MEQVFQNSAQPAPRLGAMVRFSNTLVESGILKGLRNADSIPNCECETTTKPHSAASSQPTTAPSTPLTSTFIFSSG